MEAMLGRLIGAAFMTIAPLTVGAQVPPQPSSPDQATLSEQLVRSIQTKDTAAYAALLSDNVLVFKGDRGGTEQERVLK